MPGVMVAPTAGLGELGGDGGGDVRPPRFVQPLADLDPAGQRATLEDL